MWAITFGTSLGLLCRFSCAIFSSMARPLRVVYEGAVYNVTVRGNGRGMNSMVRPVAAYALCRHGGLTQRQAAGVLGLRSGVAVSLQIRKLHEQIESNKKVRDILANLTNRPENPKGRNLVLKVIPNVPPNVP